MYDNGSFLSIRDQSSRRGLYGIRIVAQASKLALKLGGHITWKKNHGSEREQKIATVILKITGFFNVVIPFVTLGLILKGIFF